MGEGNGMSAPKAWIPRIGFAFNPLRDYPRNAPCWCGSGVKAKKCHLPTVPPTVEASKEEKLREFVSAVEERYKAGEKIVIRKKEK
jgi:hypothetical protein